MDKKLIRFKSFYGQILGIILSNTNFLTGFFYSSTSILLIIWKIPASYTFIRLQNVSNQTWRIMFSKTEKLSKTMQSKTDIQGNS